MYKIQISNLKDGEHDYEFRVNQNDIKFLEADGIEIKKEIKVETNLYKVGNQFDLKTRLTGSLLLPCDRCLENYIHDFDTSFEIIYKFDFASERTGEEINEDEIKYIPPKTGFIDMREDIRDYILLSVPMRKVPEEENKVCSYCHKNISELLNSGEIENVNPVWEKLLKTKEKK